MTLKSCHIARLNEDQMKPVVQLTLKMHEQLKSMLIPKPELASASTKVSTTYDGTKALLPLYSVLPRSQLVGGGGAGQSGIINYVLTPLLSNVLSS